MFEVRKVNQLPDFKFILQALKFWIISALILLLLASFLVSKFSIGSEKLAYISSAISFITGIFAGIGGTRNKNEGTLFTSFFISLFIIIVLLTIGFIIDSNGISSDCIISVASFSLAGCVLGGVMLSGSYFKMISKRNKRKKFKRSVN